MSWTDIGNGFIYTRQVNRIDQEISRSKGRGALLCEVRLAMLSMRPSSDSEAKGKRGSQHIWFCACHVKVGFNAGHSSLNMLLSSSPETKVRNTRWLSCYKMMMLTMTTSVVDGGGDR